MVLQITILLFLHYSALVNSLNDEGLALLSFKQSLETSSTRFLDNWNLSDSNPCSWNGIKCLEEKVTSLTLPNTGLSGSLHLDIGKLPSLHFFNIRNNHFYGSLPIELLNATGLKSLVLYKNSFSGPIPSEIGNLKYLQNLDLSENSFSGSLPSSILYCNRLKVLFLGGNNFTGSLPYGIGSNLIMLQKLNLSFNKFSGWLPNDLGNLSSLQGVLDLSHNVFDGLIPASLGDLPESVYINVAYNNLSGRIPQNGALENAGPPAFVGNPLLCGTPLKVPCPFPTKPVAAKPFETSGRKRWTPKTVIMAVSGGMMGLFFLGLSFSYCYIKFYTTKKETHVTDRNLEDKPSMRKELFCFRTDDLESLADHMEQYTFVPLDSRVNFDLEQLLKASAFLLGKSRRGIVYKAVLEKGPTVVVRRLEHQGSQRFREFQAEVETIGKIRHPNIVSILAYCWCINDKLLIYEYLPNGDLASALHGSAGMSNLRPLSWSNRLRIAKGVAKGLAFLHDFCPKRLVHGNLKPSNILLGENLEAHISDIGLTRLAYSNEELQSFHYEQSSGGTPLQSSPFSLTPTPTSLIGSSCYEAPEASKSAKPSQKWDVYAFGVVLMEMVTGKSPSMQRGSSEMDLIQWIQLGIEVKPLADILDPFLAHHLENVDEMVAALKIGLACVHVNPDKRPSMRNVSDALEKLSPST